MASGATLTQVAGTVTNGANGAIANQGTFTVEAGALGAQGTFNQDAGTTSGNPITINDANLNFTNTGASSFSFTSAGGHLSGNMAAGQSVVLQAGASVSITGGTLINNGSIISQATTAGTTISGSLINNGTFEVESGQATTIQGAYSQGSGGSLTVDVNGPSTFGHLSVTGTATLSGQLAVNTSGFTPTVGQSFAIITNSGARSGQFSSYSFGTQPYTTVYKPNVVDLVVVAGLAITTTSLPNGVVGSAYPTAALAASGGTTPYSWQVTVGSLPAGLTLNPSTGAITGTPTGPGGSSSFTVTVTDSGVPDQTQSANLSITVDAAPSFTADSPPLTATVGTAYAYTFQATGTPDTITYSLAEGAPTFLSIDPESGAVTGTPPTGTTSFTYSVTASNGVSPDATAGPFTVTVSAPPTFTADSPPLTATVGTAYAYTFAATGTPDTITYSLAEGAPAFLSIDPTTGAVTGTPPIGTTSFTYSVTASNGVSPDATAGPFTVTVSPANARQPSRPTAHRSPPRSAPPTPIPSPPPAPRTPSPTRWPRVPPPSCPSTLRPGPSPAPRRRARPASPIRSPPPTGSALTPPPGPSRDRQPGQRRAHLHGRQPTAHGHGRHPLRLYLPSTGIPGHHHLLAGRRVRPTFLSIDPSTGAVTGTPPTARPASPTRSPPPTG